MDAERKTSISYQFLPRRHFEGYEGEEDQYVVAVIEHGDGRDVIPRSRDGSFNKLESDNIFRFKSLILAKGNPEYQETFTLTAQEMVRANQFRERVANNKRAEFFVMDECEVLTQEEAASRSQAYYGNNSDLDNWFRGIVEK